MIDLSWITTSGTAVLMVVLKAVAIYAVLLFLTRTTGLRSFAKMSSFDFAMTVAMGSLLASTILTQNPPLLQAVVGLASLFGLQTGVSWLRKNTSLVPTIVDNKPLLLMAGSEVIQANLSKASVTESDLNSKLRQSGITHRDQVLAVIMETTGDVSVLKASDAEGGLDLTLFEDVRDANLLDRFSETYGD